MANRNGFYYVLDRQTGEFLTAVPYIKQTWTDGLDAKGRPFARRDADPKVNGTLVYPDITGGANWWSPSYSPKTQLVLSGRSRNRRHLLQGRRRI